MNKQEWLDRCAAQFLKRVSINAEDAMAFAEACLEFVQNDLTEPPEDAADEEMSNWG